MIGQNLLAPDPTLLPADPAAALLSPAPDAAELNSAVTKHPESSLLWALLADAATERGETITAYAYARVGYHRGLDALRKNGWKGAGPVPWSHEPNRGVLRALYALRRSAAAIGETSEFNRLTDFLNDSDPTAIAAIEATAERG